MLKTIPLLRPGLTLRPLPAPPRCPKPHWLPARPPQPRVPGKSGPCRGFAGAVTEHKLGLGELAGNDGDNSCWARKVVSVVRLVLAGAFVFLLPALGLVRPVHAEEGRRWGAPQRSVVKCVEERGVEKGKKAMVAAISVQNKWSLKDRLQYKIQEILSQNIAGKLFAVFVVALPVVGVGGFFYKICSGASWKEALFKAYNVMSDVPGADACAEENVGASIVANIIFVSGLLTFAVILGIVCDDISSIVEEVRSGNYEVLEEGHTIVLNSNKQLGSVLRQMAIARQERGLDTFKGPVIVMAAESKDDLDGVVTKALEGLNLDVRTRSGITHDLVDLKRVAADKAASIVWLDPDNSDEMSINARRATAIASLKALGTGLTRATHMVVQTPECSDSSANGLPAVALAARSPPRKGASQLDIVEMYDAQNMERLLAQCALQPGLGKVMSQILQQSQDTCEIYIKGFDQLTGLRYSEARRLFDTATPCGVIPGKGQQLFLNPSENYMIESNDKLVLIAQSIQDAKLSGSIPAEISPWTKSIVSNKGMVEEMDVLVLCFGDECEGFLEAMDEFSDESIRITVVGSIKPTNFKKSIGKCNAKFHQGNPASYKLLSKLDLTVTDSIVLAGLDDMDADTSDAQVISSLMQIQDLTAGLKRKKPIHVVAPINNPRSQEVAEHLVTEGLRVGMPCSMDLLLPSELSSGVLTQVAAAPRLDLVFKDLLNSVNQEIYIRDPKIYSLTDRGMTTWRDTMEVVRAAGESAIGYIDSNGVVCTGPPASSSRKYDEGDKLIVIAES